MKKINIEDIKKLLSDLNEFDQLDLKQIEFTENDQVIKINDSVYDEWKFVGLSNSYFVEFEPWKNT